jgi:hypothetical protein
MKSITKGRKLGKVEMVISKRGTKVPKSNLNKLRSK